jgi:DNA-binding NarL/FixJ family response regulator
VKRRTAAATRSAQFHFAGRDFLVVNLAGDEPDLLATVPPAEREVALGVLRGRSNAEIARARGTSPRTIAKQVASLFRRLGVGSRAELVGRLSGPSEPTAPARPKRRR